MNPSIPTNYFLLSVTTAFLLFMLSGCETPIELEVSHLDRELVVYAHIEVDSRNLYVYVSHTRSPGSNEVFIPIENASFRLSRDGMPSEVAFASIVYPQPGNYSLYQVKSSELIQAGSTYKIEVSTDGDYPDITAETVVPDASPSILNFEHFNTSPNGLDFYRILLDDESSADYYQISLEAYDTTGTSDMQVIQFSIDSQSEINHFPVNDAASYPLGGGHLFDDKGYNAQEKEIFISIPKGQIGANDISRGSWKYRLSLSKVSEPFYQFNKRVAQQNGTFPIPIFGTPPNPYNNVQNGYGCFSAQYTSTHSPEKTISE